MFIRPTMPGYVHWPDSGSPTRGWRRPAVEGMLRETGDSAARENYRIRKLYVADRLANLNGIDTAEVQRNMLRDAEVQRNRELAANSPAAFARLVRHPYYADARLDTVIYRPDGRVDYTIPNRSGRRNTRTFTSALPERSRTERAHVPHHPVGIR